MLTIDKTKATPAAALYDKQPKLLDRVREAIRLRHYSLSTERTYCHWAKRFILFHDKRHPAQMGAPEVEAFLSALATEGNVSASTQNQAMHALLFLYRDVLGIDLPWLDGITRKGNMATTETLLIRGKSRTIRRIQSIHYLDRKDPDVQTHIL